MSEREIIEKKSGEHRETANTSREEQINLLQSITMEVAAASDLSSALEIVLRRVCEKTGWELGQAWVPNRDKTLLVCGPVWFCGEADLKHFRAVSEKSHFQPGVGLPDAVSIRQRQVGLQSTLEFQCRPALRQERR